MKPQKLLFVIGGLALAWLAASPAALAQPVQNCAEFSDDPADPLLTACDPCVGEFCNVQTGNCEVLNPGNPCPNVQELPGCYNDCQAEVVPIGDGIFAYEPQCNANDAFCDGVSGGKLANECRAGICIPGIAPGQGDPNNPSGCDYSLTPDASLECRNCIPDGLATLENCGNGVCEPEEGESCTTCEIDCLLPGFAGNCPPDAAILADACTAPPAPAAITFDGPPYNEPFSGECEDGDLCTDNSCVIGAAPACSSTPKSCSIDQADFCCASGCQAPPAGLTCAEADAQGLLPRAECDVDCYIPEQCLPTPSPTPSPPAFIGCLEGGGGWGTKNGPGCDGFACSLNTAASALPGFGLIASLAGLLGLGVYRNLRRRGE